MATTDPRPSCAGPGRRDRSPRRRSPASRQRRHDSGAQNGRGQRDRLVAVAARRRSPTSLQGGGARNVDCELGPTPASKVLPVAVTVSHGSHERPGARHSPERGSRQRRPAPPTSRRDDWHLRRGRGHAPAPSVARVVGLLAHRIESSRWNDGDASTVPRTDWAMASRSAPVSDIRVTENATARSRSVILRAVAVEDRDRPDWR